MNEEQIGRHVQVKICGLTHPATARFCKDLKVDAVGMVFYPPSPRNVSFDTARRICETVGDAVAKVGVFVNPDVGVVMETAMACGLNTVQLHGQESPSLVDRLRQNGLRVIKALFASRQPSLKKVSDFAPHGFLIECGQGTLPGGNARQWDWSSAQSLCAEHKVLLAGGLNPSNVLEAIRCAHPAAVDVSSGVESTPGIKDHGKIAEFVEQVRKAPAGHLEREPIF